MSLEHSSTRGIAGVAVALTRQQNYEREQIDEIHAPGRAMEEVAGECGDDGSGFSSSQTED
jgi:hypothetical protein